jgi:choline dehydrogenase
LLDHPILSLLLHLREDARVGTLMHRHTNCCLRYRSGLAGAGINDMIMISGNLRAPEDGGTSRGRLAVSVYQALSEGAVRIVSRDPALDPEVEERMLSHDSDLVRMRDGVRRAREICRQPAVRAIATRVEYGLTGHSIDDALDDSALDDWMLAECYDAQHASGTCRMGAADDRRSVVDPDCRVIGCTALRVIDASIMPTVVRANTHLTTVMIAEKMAAALRRSR